ncbi:hypothetical protein [Streptomyces europaeiscabiei]|uniref:hypothetical protein n=1 Tax=Streptomyces europaeiscabiei TaxID=146819 RepID=UPI0038F5FAC5
MQGASAAQAASPYDGADPAATGCSSNAKTLASAPVCLPNTTSQVGTIEWSLMVYTSNTRSCGTGSADTGVNTAYPYGERGRQICG